MVHKLVAKVRENPTGVQEIQCACLPQRIVVPYRLDQ